MWLFGSKRYFIAAVFGSALVLSLSSCIVTSTTGAVMIAEPAALGIAQMDASSGSFTLQPSLLAGLQDHVTDGSLKSIAGGAILDLGQTIVVAAGTESFVATGGSGTDYFGTPGMYIDTRYGTLGNHLFFASSETVISDEFDGWKGTSGAFGLDLRCGAASGASPFIVMRDGLYQLYAGKSCAAVQLTIDQPDVYVDSCPLPDGSLFILVSDSSLDSYAILLLDANHAVSWRKELPGPAPSQRMFLSCSDSVAVLCVITGSDTQSKLEAVSISIAGTLTVIADYVDPPAGSVLQSSNGYWWLGTAAGYGQDGNGLYRLSPDGAITPVTLPTPPIEGDIRWAGLPDGGLIVAGPMPRMLDSESWYTAQDVRSGLALTSDSSYSDQLGWYVYRLGADGSTTWLKKGKLPSDWVSGEAHDGGVLGLCVNGGRISILLSTSILWNGLAPGYYI